MIGKIRERKETLDEEQWKDLEVAVEFICFFWASLDERPRSSIALTFSSLADKFLFAPLRTMFASGTFSFTPEQTTHEGLIIIVDFPVNEYGKSTAQLIQIMIKLTFQRAWLRHRYEPGCCNGAFLVQDEFQLLISRYESHFAQTCRGSAIAMLSITQSILGLAEELGEAQPGSKTKAFLNNMGIKIAHRTTCPDTAAYFADVIGKAFRYLENFNSGSNSESHHSQSGFGASKQLGYILEPIEFTRLQRPTSSSPYAAAIVLNGGETFIATKSDRNPQGANYLRVLFSRE